MSTRVSKRDVTELVYRVLRPPVRGLRKLGRKLLYLEPVEVTQTMIEQPMGNLEIESLLEENDVVRRACEYIDKEVLVEERSTVKPLLGWTQVSYLNHFLESGEPIQNVLGRSLELEIQGSRGVLLLIDPHPDANWGHECWIATYDEDRDDVQADASHFPPPESYERRLRTFKGSCSDDEGA